jgi:hypothetical protein
MKQKQFVKQHQQKIMIKPVLHEKTEKLWTGKNSSGLGYLRIVFLAMVIFLTTTELAKAQLQWGVNAGVNASTLSALGNLGDDNALKVGFNSGLIAKFRLNDWLSVKSGIDYQMKGEKSEEAISKNEIETSLSYLVLPVKAEFSASEKAGFKNGQRLFFATGPYLGYLLDSKQTISGQTADLNDFNKGDFGWNFELGFEFPVLKDKAIQVSLNYDMGFSEIATDMNAQNKTASLNFGFLF